MARRTRQSGGKFRGFLTLLVLGLVAFAGLAAFRVGGEPDITIDPQLPGIGKSTPVKFLVSEGSRGLSRIRVELIQSNREPVVLDERSYEPLKPWEFWGERITDDEFELAIGSETVEQLEEGRAMIRVVAGRAPAFLRRPLPSIQELTLDVMLRPPQLQVTSSRTYLKQGGCEVVVYTLGETAVADGVQAGEVWFPGYPLPGGGSRDRFALFGAPFDLEDAGKIRLVARDAVGNESRTEFLDRYTPRPFKRDEIRISDRFMSRVVPAILGQTPDLKDRGDLLENYLAINRELRKANNDELVALAGKSAPEFYWKQPFLQMRNAKVMSDFADRRTYLYNGKVVDHQDHLGFDLASVRQAPLEAANDGVVMLARYFGIYGNTVVIDHGYGLMSLYGHMSTLDVEEGQTVSRGEVIGRTGATGLAGGDHLHFTMLLQGMPVNPREWWDGHWIQDRLALKLGKALPYEP